jgi:hypothetical protein
MLQDSNFVSECAGIGKNETTDYTDYTDYWVRKMDARMNVCMAALINGGMEFDWMEGWKIGGLGNCLGRYPHSHKHEKLTRTLNQCNLCNLWLKIKNQFVGRSFYKLPEGL